MESKLLEVGDILLKVKISRHSSKHPEVIREIAITRVTKKYAFGENGAKFSRDTDTGEYQRHDYITAHFEGYILKD